MKIAPSTYYARKSRPLSARAVRDTVMMQILMVLWVSNRKVYGARKLWIAAQRAGHDIGRDQVARLMREMGIRGISRRGNRVFTTRQDPAHVRAVDLVKRQFTAAGPDRLWVTDIIYVKTRAGTAYVCFLELATLSWVHWWNHDRLHSHCGDIPPAEYETAYHAANEAAPTGVGNQQTETPANPAIHIPRGPSSSRSRFEPVGPVQCLGGEAFSDGSLVR